MYLRYPLYSLLLGGALSSGCGHVDRFVRDDIIVAPTPVAFSICHGHTCARVDQLAMMPAEWARIRSLFLPVAGDARQERLQIQQAISSLEKRIGTRIGTDADRGGNWKGFGHPGQMDCIDESTNTTTYLRMLADDGLLQWHRVVNRSTRGWLLFGWPHTTAVIEEIATGERFAVDSWFGDNGTPPSIVPLAEWKSGWRPDSDE